MSEEHAKVAEFWRATEEGPLDKPTIFRVMLSSTYKDLLEERQIVRDVFHRFDLFVEWMEKDSSRDTDLVTSSLEMVDKSDAYFCILGKRYGHCPADPRNPNELSLTELEYSHAEALGLKIWSLAMDPAYPTSDEDNEFDPVARKKREAFLAKMQATLRIVDSFQNDDEFKSKVERIARDIRKTLDRADPSISSTPVDPPEQRTERAPNPAAPEFFCVKPFARGHKFVGRERELTDLSAWAVGDDAMMIVRAMGGMGKSHLTYQWTDKDATKIGTNWTGRCWYSFYEDSAGMEDFLGWALAYVLGQPRSSFNGQGIVALAERLLEELRSAPWLLVLDGLERVLVRYNRGDRSERFDDDNAGDPEHLGRNPLACLRDSDAEILKLLIGAAPSKILISTRDIPTCLRNSGDDCLPGITSLALEGLAPEDAEEMLRQSGVVGNGDPIRSYLLTHFGCHPLMIGIIAGLVRRHPPAPGDFDAWLSAPTGASAVDLAKLDGLVRKRHHIFEIALADLDVDENRVLHVLAGNSAGVEWDALTAMNPRRPAAPRVPMRPIAPTSQSGRGRKAYERSMTAYTTARGTYRDWQRSTEVTEADNWLARTVMDLRDRGLITHSGHGINLYNLHPLVRSFVRDNMSAKERQAAGRAVADYATSRAPAQFENLESLEELAPAIQEIESLIFGGFYEEAKERLLGDFHGAMRRLDLDGEYVRLAKEVLPDGGGLGCDASYADLDLAGRVGWSLKTTGYVREATELFTSVLTETRLQTPLLIVRTAVRGFCDLYRGTVQRGLSDRCLSYEVDLSFGEEYPHTVHRTTELITKLDRGDLDGADAQLRDPDFALERQGFLPPWIEADVRRRKQSLTERMCTTLLNQCAEEKDTASRFDLLLSIARWHAENGRFETATDVFNEVIEHRRVHGKTTDYVEVDRAICHAEIEKQDQALNVLTRVQDGWLDNRPCHHKLAQGWLALGDKDKARDFAIAGYKIGWGDGPPHHDHWMLEDCRAVLLAVGAPEPDLPIIDRSSEILFDWEPSIRAYIAHHKEQRSREA